MQLKVEQRHKVLRNIAVLLLLAAAFQVLAVLNEQSDFVSLAFLEAGAAALLCYRSRRALSGAA